MIRTGNRWHLAVVALACALGMTLAFGAALSHAKPSGLEDSEEFQHALRADFYGVQLDMKSGATSVGSLRCQTRPAPGEPVPELSADCYALLGDPVGVVDLLKQHGADRGVSRSIGADGQPHPWRLVGLRLTAKRFVYRSYPRLGASSPVYAQYGVTPVIVIDTWNAAGTKHISSKQINAATGAKISFKRYHKAKR